MDEIKLNQVDTCPHCGGTGGDGVDVSDYCPCPQCGGTGRNEQVELLEIEKDVLFQNEGLTRGQ